MEISTMLLVAILVLAVLALFKGTGSDTARLRSIERKLDLTLKQLGVDPNEGLDEQIKQLVRSGQKIEAIKLYRAQSGAGLKEAKDHIEAQYGA
jgi:ribosomal protein L7/L12